jgi:diguanylate cyclase (GGDEF)-like protein
MPDPATMLERIRLAMSRAQTGEAALAAVDARAMLTELAGEMSSTRAMVEYVRAVAAHYLGDVDEALDAVRGCVEASRVIGEPGWEANALAVRIIMTVRGRRPGDTVADLVAAENALLRTTDTAVAGWAHTGLGYAYDLLRLYELAIPHLERATEIDVDPLGLAESPAIDRLNLAETNMRWADELRRLGEPAYAEEIADRLTDAARWASEALKLVERDGAGEVWLLSSRMWLAAATVGEDPGTAAAELCHCRDRMTELGSLPQVAEAGAYLASAYAALGRTEDAREAAERAVRDLPLLADPAAEALTRYTVVHIAADSGSPGALAGLEYAQAIARGWWAERSRGLHAVQRALDAHDLSIRHDAEWQAARQDPLTRIGNRRALDERLAAAAESGEAIAVVAIDVDNMKLVNDTHGHPSGDELLRAVAELIVDQTRAVDVVVRPGGDEFIVVLADPGPRSGIDLMERIRAAAARIAAEPHAKPWLENLRLSLGHASTADGTPISQLIREADKRLYADKRRRRLT